MPCECENTFPSDDLSLNHRQWMYNTHIEPWIWRRRRDEICCETSFRANNIIKWGKRWNERQSFAFRLTGSLLSGLNPRINVNERTSLQLSDDLYEKNSNNRRWGGLMFSLKSSRRRRSFARFGQELTVKASEEAYEKNFLVLQPTLRHCGSKWDVRCCVESVSSSSPRFTVISVFSRGEIFCYREKNEEVLTAAIATSTPKTSENKKIPAMKIMWRKEFGPRQHFR